MRKAGGLPTGRQGYTIIEVLIVLAISMVLFFIAIGLFSGKNNSTQFSQAMQDLASKIQSYTNQITSGVTPDFSQYSCSVSAARPIFNSGSGDKSACIYLGRALLVSPNSTTISAYSVAGDKFAYGDSTQGLAQTFDQTNSTTSRLGSPCTLNCDLFLDTYTLNNGIQIVSSRIMSNAGGSAPSGYGLVGLYTDVAGTSASDTANSSGLLTKAYLFSGGPAGVQSCIETSGSCNTPVNNFFQWQVCLQYGGGGPKAQLNMNPTGSGLSTEIIYQNNCT